MPDWNWQKISKSEPTPWGSFKQACLNSWDYTINHNDNREEKEK